MEFVEKRAKELYVSSSGLSKPANQFGFGFPFLSYSDIFRNYFAPTELTTLVNSSEKDRKSCSVKRGDVFLTRTSETTDELGMSCVALKDYPDATFNGFAKRLRPITDEIVPEYAAYYFRSSFFRAQCMSMASLITRASLNDSMIHRFKIRYPKSKKLQAVIGETLMNYDNLIEVNNKRIKVLEQMAENLYKEWFVRFRFPGHETTEFENGIPKGWLSKTNKRPKNWHYGCVSELGLFIRGKNITSDEMIEGTIPVISAGLEPSGYHNESNVKGKSITISASGANAGFMQYNLDDIWAADCSYMRDNNAFWFVYHSLRFIQPVIRNLQCGAAQPHVYPKHINKLCIIIPEQKHIVDFCRMVSPYYEEVGKLKAQNNNLIKQRDLLLPRLMSGKLEV